MKNGRLDPVAVCGGGLGEPKEPCMKWGRNFFHGKGLFWGRAAQCSVYGERGIGRAKTAEPIELLFGK